MTIHSHVVEDDYGRLDGFQCLVDDVIKQFIVTSQQPFRAHGHCAVSHYPGQGDILRFLVHEGDVGNHDLIQFVHQIGTDDPGFENPVGVLDEWDVSADRIVGGYDIGEILEFVPILLQQILVVMVDCVEKAVNAVEPVVVLVEAESRGVILRIGPLSIEGEIVDGGSKRKQEASGISYSSK